MNNKNVIYSVFLSALANDVDVGYSETIIIHDWNAKENNRKEIIFWNWLCGETSNMTETWQTK